MKTSLQIMFTSLFLAGSAMAQQPLLSSEQPTSAPMPAAQAVPAAQGEIIDSVGGDAIPALLSGVETSNGIQYMTGGVGDEDVVAIKAAEPKFNVHVLIATTAGEYLSNMTVALQNKAGQKLLEVQEAGPYFMALLAVGEYQLTATDESGVVQTIKFSVPANAKHPLKTTLRFKS